MVPAGTTFGPLCGQRNNLRGGVMEDDAVPFAGFTEQAGLFV